jgi:hypothetical protein
MRTSEALAASGCHGSLPRLRLAILFGLAIWLPSAAVRYARSGLLLAALVSIPILQFWLIFSSQSDPNGVPGRWLLRFDWLLDPYSMFVLAALAGVAIASGFRQPDPTSRAG